MTKENTIQIYRTTNSGTTPSNLNSGELAVNLTDKKLFVGDGNGSNFELTRLADSQSDSDALAIQFADTTGYLTSRPDNLYWNEEEGVDTFYVVGTVDALAINAVDVSTVNLKATASEAYVFNDTCETLNIGGDATEINIGNKAGEGYVNFGIGIVTSNGTSTIPSLKISSGGKLTNPVEGVIEFDSTCFYATNNCGRATIALDHYAIVNSNINISNTTSSQAVFVTDKNKITLAPSTTYSFEGFYRIISGTTSHSTGMSFDESTISGDQTGATSWYWMTISHGGSIGVPTKTQETCVFNASAGGDVNSASASALTQIWFRGVVTTSSNPAPITPKIKFSAQPGGTNQIGVGSFIRFVPLGQSDVQSVGPWS
jgi:hypothetical protein